MVQQEDHGTDTRTEWRGVEEAEMWFLVALVVLIAVIISRRGSTGASRALDLRAQNPGQRPQNPGTYGGAGDMGGDGGGT